MPEFYVLERGHGKGMLSCASALYSRLLATLGRDAEVVEPHQFADIASIRNMNPLINSTHASITSLHTENRANISAGAAC